MRHRMLRHLAAVALLLLPAASAAAGAEPPEEVVRGILREIGAAAAPCPQEAISAFADRELLCGAYPKQFSYFKLDWETALARYDLRSRVTPASPWVLRGGRYVRDYEAVDVKLTVSFDESSGRVTVAFTLPDENAEAQSPLPAAPSRSSPADAAPIAGFGGVSAPVLVPESRVEPALPGRAAELGIEGEVTLQLLVRRDGTVGEVRVLREAPGGWGFGEAASRAVGQWLYEPARRDGEPVDAWFTVFYEFEPR